MKIQHLWRRAISIVLTMTLLFSNFLFIPTYAEDAEPIDSDSSDTGEIVTTTINLNDYIVFDLSAANVIINGTNYSGCIWQKVETTVGDQTVISWEKKTVSSKTRNANDKFYVYQNSTKQSVVQEGDLLTMTALDIKNEITVNNTDISNVEERWAAAAAKGGRSVVTSYFIRVSSSSVNCNLTIDDLWCMHQNNSPSWLTNSNKANGGINIGVDTSAMMVTLNLRGDNRLAYLGYYCKSSAANATNGLTVCDDNSDGESNIGSLTVIGDPKSYADMAGKDYYKNSSGKNNWNSVIGATDSTDNAYNMYFNSGVIYAGAHRNENCSAIGGGGNGVGEVTITGGQITAITYSTGTAIGGGIAHTGTGGKGLVTISGGEVYAYNFGLPAHDRVTPGKTGYDTTDTAIIAASKHIPGTAIGGASSIKSDGANDSVINILGGYVYAESWGGAGIGGGNTIRGIGGGATVNIYGGTVYAQSTALMMTFDDNSTFEIKQGTGIGGGSSTYKNGGTATVNITHGRVYADGIGGGNSTQNYGGSATVNMSGGTVVCDGIGGGFSSTNGYATGSVIVTGGSLNSAMAAIPKNDTGDTLYLTRISIFYEASALASKEVESFTYGVSAKYKLNDVYTDSNGMIYLWLPLGTTITGAKLTDYPDHTFSPDDEPDLDIDANDIGAMVYRSTAPRYILTLVSGEGYSLFTDEDMLEPLFGSAIVEQGVFTYYMQVEKGFSITPYVGTVRGDGSKVILPLEGAMTLVSSGDVSDIYLCSVYAQSDTAVWHYSVNSNTDPAQKRFIFDLSIGDLTITEEENGTLTIVQNGYSLSLTEADVDIYLTSAGFPTSNTVTVDSNKSSESNINIIADKLNLNSSGTAINILGGNVNLQFGEYDNIINSNTDSPIRLNQGASLNLTTQGNESLKLSASVDTVPIIVGAGTLNLDNQDGFLSIKEPVEGVAQFTVGAFNFEGQNDQFSAELYRGDYKNYTVIGYIQNGVLKNINEQPDTKMQFSACGIVEHYSSIKSNWTVSNGTFTIKLTVDKSDSDATFVGFYKITKEDGTDITEALRSAGMITETTGAARSTGLTEITVNIDGSYFKTGNIILYAAAEGKIATSVLGENSSIIFDNSYHIGIRVLVDTTIFDVYYSTETLDSTNYKSGQTTPLSFINVGTYTVYYYVCEKEGSADERDYTPVASSASFTITEGTNEFYNDLVCPNIICGQQPAPKSTAKWNNETTSYTFYIDNSDGIYDNDVIIENPEEYFAALTTESFFYVVATVAESADGNFGALTSERKFFKALKLSAYAQDGRQLSKITEGVTGALDIANTGVFSAYFRGASIGAESRIDVVGCVLPVDTKITLISLSGSTAQYYYHFVTSEDASGANTVIKLNEFILMGTDNTKFTPTESGSVEYQFCIEYQNLTGGAPLIELQLNGQTEDCPTFSRKLSWSEQLAIINATNSSRIDIVAGEGTINITVKTEMKGTAAQKLLAFRITDQSDGSSFSLVNMETALSVVVNNDLVDPEIPITSTKDFLMFHIGDYQTTSIEKTFTLVISNVPEGTYDLSVTADVRMKDSDIDARFAMDGETAVNHCEVNTSVTVQGKRYLNIDTEDPYDRIIDENTESLSFNVQVAPADPNPTLKVRIYKKDGTLLIQEQELAVANGKITIGNVQSLFANAENGTYRVEFQYAEAISALSLIVAK